MGTGGPPETVHDGNTQTGFANRFCDDGVETGLIEAAQDEEETDGSLGEFAASGAQRLNAFPVVKANKWAVIGTGVTEETVTFAFFGVKISGLFQQNERGLRRVMTGELAGR